VGVIFKTSVNTVSAGSTRVAPKGEISADMETRNMIQLFIPALKTLYGGPEAVRCSAIVSRGSVFSSSVIEGAGAVRACWVSSSPLRVASFFVSLSVSASFFWEPAEAEEVSELPVILEVPCGISYVVRGIS
jgi:hypothetical protein